MANPQFSSTNQTPHLMYWRFLVDSIIPHANLTRIATADDDIRVEFRKKHACQPRCAMKSASKNKFQKIPKKHILQCLMSRAPHVDNAGRFQRRVRVVIIGDSYQFGEEVREIKCGYQTLRADFFIDELSTQRQQLAIVGVLIGQKVARIINEYVHLTKECAKIFLKTAITQNLTQKSNSLKREPLKYPKGDFKTLKNQTPNGKSLSELLR